MLMPGTTRHTLRQATVIFTLAAFLAGCATQPLPPGTSPPTGDRTIPRDIVVTAAHFQPEAKIDLLLRSRAELAGAGAGGGALEGLGGLMQGMGSCHDQYCGAAFLLLLPVFMGVGAIVGAVTNAPSAASAALIESGQKSMQAGIARLDLQRSVQSAIAKELAGQGVASHVAEEWDVGPATPEEAPAYESVNPETRDAILEASVLGFQFKTAPRAGSKKINYTLSMKTRLRLLAPASRKIMDEMNDVYESEPHTASEWLDGEAQLFKAALDEAIRDTARAAVHEMFLLYYPDGTLAGKPEKGQLVPDYVLKPLYPVPVQSIDLRGAFLDKYKSSFGNLQFVPVDSLQPTLQWEAFPRPLDVATAGGRAARFSDVRYEIALFDARLTDLYYQPGMPIYRRSGLIEPSHRLETSLQPCARYFWSVRAHFKLDGWPRRTEWSGAYDVFPTTKPWEFRRGLTSGPTYRAAVEPRILMLPFRAPSAGGSACQ